MWTKNVFITFLPDSHYLFSFSVMTNMQLEFILWMNIYPLNSIWETFMIVKLNAEVQGQDDTRYDCTWIGFLPLRDYLMKTELDAHLLKFEGYFCNLTQNVKKCALFETSTKFSQIFKKEREQYNWMSIATYYVYMILKKLAYSLLQTWFTLPLNFLSQFSIEVFCLKDAIMTRATKTSRDCQICTWSV